MPKHYDTRIKHRRAMNVSRPSKSPPTKHTVETQSFFVYRMRWLWPQRSKPNYKPVSAAHLPGYCSARRKNDSCLNIILPGVIHEAPSSLDFRTAADSIQTLLSRTLISLTFFKQCLCYTPGMSKNCHLPCS